MGDIAIRRVIGSDFQEDLRPLGAKDFGQDLPGPMINRMPSP